MKFKAIPISFKISAINILMILGILYLGFEGHHSINNVLKLSELNNALLLTQSHMEADMMHDAIHSNIMRIMIASKEGDMDEIKNAITSLEESTQKLKNSFDTSKKNKFNEDIGNKIQNTTAIIDKYIKQSTEIKTVALNKEDNTLNKLNTLYKNEFLQTFREIEVKFDEVSTSIKTWSDDLTNESQKNAESGKISLLISMAISLFLGILVPLYLRYGLFVPLNKLLAVSRNLLNGQLSEKPPYLSRQDEIGKIAASLSELQGKMTETNQLKQMIDELPINIMVADPLNDFKIIYLNRSSKETLKKLQTHLPVPADNIFGSSIDVFHKDPQRIRNLLSDARNLPHHARIKLGSEMIDQRISAVYDANKKYIGTLLCWSIATQNEKLARDFEHSIGAVSSQISSSAGTLEQRAVALQGAIEELSSAAREISKRTHDSLEIVQEAVNKGDSARGHMTQLSTAAEKVSSVVTLIRSIAEKTNLLALNATIESARAGEAGKGFAVVANEVKNLANQTGTAITDIHTQISDMQSFAQATFDTVNHMCDTIVSVNKISTDIASAVEEQRASTSEIVRSIGKTSDTDSSNSIMSMAGQLKQASNALSKDCESFLEKVQNV